ncbi:DNA integrity scanning protein DisA nucleotide-binding domain protein [Fusibacter bizertensis]
MFFANLSKLHQYIDGYCFALFRRIDEEMVPQLHLIDENKLQTDLVKNIMDIEEHNLYLSDLFEFGNKKYQFALQFDPKSIEVYYKIPDGFEFRFRSLLDSIIYETLSYINECVQGLILQDDIHELHYSDLLKRSGKLLLQHVLQNEHAISPFEKINKISSLSYEKSFSNGKILLLNLETSQTLSNQHILKPMVNFETKIPLSNTRHIRKILELSNPEVYLLSDGEYLYSTVEINQHHDKIHHFFIIEFNNYFSWQLTHNGNRLMQVTHEEVFIPKPKVSFFSFSIELKKVFPLIESKKLLNLYLLILEALKQSKGTIIVISKNARSEAFRLRNQGFLIDALSLSPSIVRSITSIDGAVLMDLDGFCHGIGVILDGIATEKGDPSRGARYNSAIRYVETIKKTPEYANCFAVVISEDGDVDMISHFL